MDFSPFRVLSFDCYGTLIDWESGIWDAFRPALRENARGDIGREALLEAFARIESETEARHPAMPYDEILARVHAGLCEAFGLRTTAALNRGFAASLPRWPAFPDSADALRRLKRRFLLVVLSNVHRAGFRASARRLGVRFDAVYTAQDIGSYKPDPANFRYMLTRLKEDFGVGRGEILHVAQSLFHDHVPARAAGLANVWIDRRGQSRGGTWGATARPRTRPEVCAIWPDMESFAAAAA